MSREKKPPLVDSVIRNDYSNRMTGFTKLFSTIIDSTVWREAMHVKVVWITMLAKADRNGVVPCSFPGLADAARVSLDECRDALDRLMAPDPHSRTKLYDGRRIEECDGGWQILNYLKYRELASRDERRIKVRDAVAKHRRNQSVISGNQSNHIAEAEAEAEAEGKASERPARGAKATWLTPYCDLWTAKAGTPPVKRMAAALAPVHKEIGPARLVQALDAYLDAGKGALGIEVFARSWRDWDGRAGTGHLSERERKSHRTLTEFTGGPDA